MRVDHHAYRRATRVAGFGLLLQAAIALTLLIFGVLAGDTVFRFAAFYLLGGLLLWLALIAVFYQHTQERLEALEEDELAATRGASVFEREGEKVAARRLRLMHQWLMPIVSVLVAVYLGLGAAWMLRFLGSTGDPTGTGADFTMTAHKGWAVAVCLGFAAVSFIFSRFVAGMARQPAWQNLRGGAGYMVGNALVMLAAAVGLMFRFFDNDRVILWVAYALPAFMLFLVVEIAIHFILNVYRPRVPGEVPRPAFDSRVLSLLAAPESIVRSLNEAVNYQFGFDITSSWGYQLMLRSIGGLIAFGALVLVLLNMMVVVEPNQQAIKLAGGRIVGDVYGSGLMWKLPWPFETAAIYDVGGIRTLPLTAQRVGEGDVQVWSEKIQTRETLDPFIVAGSRLTRAAGKTTGAPSDLFSLVDAEISLLYRIRPDGLMDYLGFASDELHRRRSMSTRDSALRALALRTITQHLSTLDLDSVLTTGSAELLEDLRGRIQTAFDDVGAGVEVVAVQVPMLRPSGDVATYWEDYSVAIAQRRERVAKQEQRVAESLAFFIGDPAKAPEILEGIAEWKRLRDELGPDHERVIAQQLLVQDLFTEAGGALALEIATAAAQHWIKLMQARAEVYEHQSRLAAYRAAPNLFMQREIMRVLGGMLAEKRKYMLVGVDPTSVDVEIELRESPSLFSFSDAVPSESESEQ